MKKMKFLFLAIVFFSSCQSNNSATSKFELFAKNLETELGIVFTEKGSDEKYLLPIDLMEEDTTERTVDFYNQKFEEINKFEEDNFDETVKENWKWIRNFLELKKQEESGKLKIISPIQFLKVDETDQDQTDENQFIKINFHLEEIPAYFSKAKQLIKNPTKEKLEQAIQQYSEDYFYLKNELPANIRKPDILKEDQIRFSKKNKNAQIAIKDFIAFLNSCLFEIQDEK